MWPIIHSAVSASGNPKPYFGSMLVRGPSFGQVVSRIWDNKELDLYPLTKDQIKGRFGVTNLDVFTDAVPSKDEVETIFHKVMQRNPIVRSTVEFEVIADGMHKGTNYVDMTGLETYLVLQ